MRACAAAAFARRFHRIVRDVKGGGHLHVTGGRQQLQDPQFGSCQRCRGQVTSLRGVCLRAAYLQGRTDEPFQERLRLYLRRMLDQVARHLGRGRDDRIEEASVAGCVEHAADDAVGSGVAALDRGGGQEYLAYQRGSRCQVPQRPRIQVLQGSAVIVRGERDPGQQQTAPGGGQPGRQPVRRAQVAERKAQLCLQLVGSRQEH